MQYFVMEYLHLKYAFSKQRILFSFSSNQALLLCVAFLLDLLNR